MIFNDICGDLFDKRKVHQYRCALSVSECSLCSWQFRPFCVSSNRHPTVQTKGSVFSTGEASLQASGQYRLKAHAEFLHLALQPLLGLLQRGALGLGGLGRLLCLLEPGKQLLPVAQTHVSVPRPSVWGYIIITKMAFMITHYRIDYLLRWTDCRIC